MGRSEVLLSRRLQMLAHMVTPGNRVADVGCDHGFLSIYLVQTGVCPRVIAMDVRQGPLAGAKEHIEAYGVGDYIETRLSDGLNACSAEEVETVVCAGMGGRLMEKILVTELDKVRRLKELILQPQSEIPRFRAFLREAGLKVVSESAVFEEGKYYFAMKVLPGQEDELPESAGVVGLPGDAGPDADRIQRLFDLYGRYLLLQKDPVLQQYLQERRRYVGELLASLEGAASEKAQQRLGEVRQELEDIQTALALMEAHGAGNC